MRDTSSQHLTWKHWLLAAVCFKLLGLVILFNCLFQGQIWLPTGLLHHVMPDVPGPALPWNVLGWDGLAQFGAWRIWSGQWISHGVLPLWNPHQFGGYPLYANSQSALFYPFNLIFAVVGAGGFAVTALIHMVIAGLGVWALVCSAAQCRWSAGIVAGAVFILSQWYISWQFLPTLPQSASWIPWMLYAVWMLCQRPSPGAVVLLGFSGAMCVLAGHLQIVFYGVIACVLMALWHLDWSDLRRAGASIGALVGAGLLAFSLAAPQLIPALRLGSQSSRNSVATEEGYQAYVQGGVAHDMWGMLASPMLYGDHNLRSSDQPHTSSYVGTMPAPEAASFVGVCGLFLGLAGLFLRKQPGRGAMFSIAALAVLLASGSIINKLFYFGIPGFASSGSPGRALVLWALGLAVLAGYGFDELWRMERKSSWLTIGLAIFATAGAMLCGASSILSITTLSAAQMWPYIMTTMSTSILLVLMLALCSSLPVIGRSLAIPLCCLIVIGELLYSSASLNQSGSREQLFPANSVVKQLRQLTNHGERIYVEQGAWSLSTSPKAVLPPNLATIYGLYDLQGYDSLAPSSAKRMLDRIARRDSAPPENGNMQLGWPGADRERLREMGVGAILRWASSGPLVERLAHPRSIIQQGSVDLPSKWQNPNQLDLLKPAAKGHLLFASPYYPGWHAQLASGQLVPLKALSNDLMGLPDGKGVVRLVFRPADLQIGYVLAGLGLVVLVSLLLLQRVKLRA
ncbi:MAG: hypothetical protein ACYC1M_13085 [Armatimonadota bacterium]